MRAWPVAVDMGRKQANRRDVVPAPKPGLCPLRVSLTAERSGRSRPTEQFMALFLIAKECLLDYPITVLHPTMRPYVAGAFMATLQDRVSVLCTSVSNIDCTGSFHFHFLV